MPLWRKKRRIFSEAAGPRPPIKKKLGQGGFFFGKKLKLDQKKATFIFKGQLLKKMNEKTKAPIPNNGPFFFKKFFENMRKKRGGGGKKKIFPPSKATFSAKVKQKGGVFFKRKKAFYNKN